MMRLPSIALLILPLAAPLQNPPLQQADLVAEVRALRASIEQMEKGQRMLVALGRIQIAETRLAGLERQREPLATEERTLSQELDRLAVSLRREGNGQSAVTGAPTAPGQPGVSGTEPIQARSDEVNRRLGEVRRDLQVIDASMVDLRASIAAWEKVFGDLSR